MFLIHSRQEKIKKILGSILALTYTDKIDGEIINELSAIGYNLAKDYKINTSNKYKSFMKI